MEWMQQEYWECSQEVKLWGDRRVLTMAVRRKANGQYWWWIEYADRPYRALSAGSARDLPSAQKQAESELQEIVWGMPGDEER